MGHFQDPHHQPKPLLDPKIQTAHIEMVQRDSGLAKQDLHRSLWIPKILPWEWELVKNAISHKQFDLPGTHRWTRYIPETGTN